MKKGIFLGLLVLCGVSFAGETLTPKQEPIREVAITIDDLPFVGTTRNRPKNLEREHKRFMKILNAIKERGVPASGFVVAGTIEKGQWELLEAFHKAGLTIANHTYSHLNLNATSAERYIKNIERADQVLAPLMGNPKYFRYPYLAEGRGKRKEEVLEYLKTHDYVVAPVTIDSKDFQFNQQLYRVRYRQRPNYVQTTLKRRYLNYIWAQTKRAERKADTLTGKPVKQILLLHANLLNSFVMGDIIDMYQSKGYKIISIEEAMKDTNVAKLKLDTTSYG